MKYTEIGLKCSNTKCENYTKVVTFKFKKVLDAISIARCKKCKTNLMKMDGYIIVD